MLKPIQGHGEMSNLTFWFRKRISIRMHLIIKILLEIRIKKCILTLMETMEKVIAS